MTKHSVVHWSLPRDSKKRAEVEAAEARINEAVAT